MRLVGARRLATISESGNTPSQTATSTYTDGVAYLFNETPGEITVSAMHPSMTFASHGLKAWPDVLTTTVIVP